MAADFCLQVLQVGVFGLQITPPSFGSHFTLVTYLFLDELYIHIFFCFQGVYTSIAVLPTCPRRRVLWVASLVSNMVACGALRVTWLSGLMESGRPLNFRCYYLSRGGRGHEGGSVVSNRM